MVHRRFCWGQAVTHHTLDEHVMTLFAFSPSPWTKAKFPDRAISTNLDQHFTALYGCHLAQCLRRNISIQSFSSP